ncbi:Piso0_000077 [Millerozyma farinosa CBS 7064]|uniref:Piso0_000077 protein n=1 Tax=Pichia sorbitophila (strain ATCC MYA-4447 / BCRC 22081 / CBS 7064 / NBRC 10061 / NRRL Y-12695) TaxID=559304 RepID=G8YT13_PICSO|nr:Piso0_000077 [Millerozyma farinosa CBS 7064]
MYKLLANRGLSGSISRYASPFSAVRFYTKYPQNEQIFVHPHDKVFKLSFSPEENSVPLGYSSTSKDITPSNFRANQEFVSLLHDIISKNIQDDFCFIMEAGTFANSFMPIYDFRDVPRYGRTPEVDGTFGFVQVDSNGKMVPGTYESNNMYRLCNGEGLIKLSDHLHEVVMKNI